MNRKQRREMMRKMQSEDFDLVVVHPHAAGIDIGNESHYVAVPSIRDSAAFARSRCNLRECIGLRSTTFWKQRVWKSIW